jgi:nitrile hydratase accessory protein
LNPPTAPETPGPDTPERPFAAPWQAQAFALTVALHRAGLFSWPDWAQALGAELRGGARDGSDYWDRWLLALERLVTQRTGAAPGDLAAIAARWQAAARATPHGQPITLDAPT